MTQEELEKIGFELETLSSWIDDAIGYAKNLLGATLSSVKIEETRDLKDRVSGTRVCLFSDVTKDSIKDLNELAKKISSKSDLFQTRTFQLEKEFSKL